MLITENIIQAGVKADKAGQMLVPCGSNHTFHGDHGGEFLIVDQRQGVEVDDGRLWDVPAHQVVELKVHIADKVFEQLAAWFAKKHTASVALDHLLDKLVQNAHSALLYFFDDV
jgi:hypothetical protein